MHLAFSLRINFIRVEYIAQYNFSSAIHLDEACTVLFQNLSPKNGSYVKSDVRWRCPATCTNPAEISNCSSSTQWSEFNAER